MLPNSESRISNQLIASELPRPTVVVNAEFMTRCASLCPNSTRRTRTRTEPDRTGPDPTRHSVRVSGLQPGRRHVRFWLNSTRGPDQTLS